MLKVQTKQIVKTIQTDIEKSPAIVRKASSGISVEELEEALRVQEEESDQNQGVLASKKRARSHSLKAIPVISLGDSYTFSKLRSYQQHSDFITKVRLLPDSTTQLCSSGNDGKLVFYNTEEENPTTFQAHQQGITDFDISRNYLLTGSLDGFVKLWLLQGTINTRPLETYTVGNRINAVCFNPMNTQQFVVADAKGRVLLFTGKAKQGTPIIKSNFSFLQTTQPEPINCLLFSSSGRYLITGGASGELCVFEQLSQPPRFQLVKQTNLRYSITGLAYSDKKSCLLVSSCDHKTRLFDCPSLELCKSSDSNVAIVASEDYHIHLFDIESGGLLKKWQGHDTVVSSIDVSGRDEILVSSSFDGEVIVWEHQHS